MAKKALEGITILDMTLAESGPVATMGLSLLGAKVYHIYRPGAANVGSRYRGEVLRNLNKTNITINGKVEEGAENFWKLIEKADIIFENYGPGAWDRMGFSYEEVKKRNPNIIYVTLKGFARESEWGKCVTIDPVPCSFGGSAYISGYENEVPMLCGINVADSGSGIHATLTTLLAILERKLTGNGQFIETPMRDTVVCLTRKAYAEYAANGSVKRHGNSFHGADIHYPYNMYPSKPSADPRGDYIQISCKTDEDFANLAKAMGKPELAEDPRFTSNELRLENRDALDEIIKEWTLAHDKVEANTILLKDYKVPAGAVMSIGELLKDPFLNTTIYRNVSDKVCGDMVIPTIPVRLSDSPMDVIESAGVPEAGNDEVYKELLGLSDERIAELKEKGAI